MDRAKEVVRFFYNSNYWRRSAQWNEPVDLFPYIPFMANALSLHPDDILESFKIAHTLQWVTICPGPNQKVYVKEGPQKGECFWNKTRHHCFSSCFLRVLMP